MSIRFTIKNTMAKAEKEGDQILRYSGVSEPFNRVSERECSNIGNDKNGEPKLTYVTGLDTKRVKFFKWYNEEEQAEVVKQIQDLQEDISKFYGGDSVLDEANAYFWGKNRDVSRLSLSNDNIGVFYDTTNPAHALLYLGLISGAFIDLVAPTRDWAERHQIQHYLALETDDSYDDEDEITKSDAHAALAELRKEEGTDALFILAWCIQYDTRSFGAYLKSTPMRDLINYHIKYIDGKLVTKRKKNTPKVFLEYYNKWKGQQTKKNLFVEAYVKAGEYYNFLNQRDKKFTTADGTALGNTVDEAVQNLLKPKFSQDLEKLREQVENKWKE